jgi:F-type H+-transporting ATPase subunit epsilon
MASQHAMRVEIVTPYQMFFEGSAEMVVITSKDGEVGIMPGHTPLMVALTPGEIRIRVNQEWRVASASNGYAEISPELTIIIVNAAEWAEEIDVKRATRALERADKRFHDKDTPAAEKVHARHGVQRARARLHVANKYGHLLSTPPLSLQHVDPLGS